MPNFLDEIDGGFVVYTLASSAIAQIVGKRVYPEVAPQDESQPHIIYTMANGHRAKSHNGPLPGGQRNMTLHAYAIGRSQPQANDLAQLLEDRWLAADNAMAAGTLVQVCNGGQYDGGQWFPKDSSDDHLFYRRLVFNLLLGQ